jgi:hypothetical protein
MTEPNPWAPLVELYRLGCIPIGYATMPGDSEVAFTVYVPTRRAGDKGDSDG